VSDRQLCQELDGSNPWPEALDDVPPARGPRHAIRPAHRPPDGMGVVSTGVGGDGGGRAAAGLHAAGDRTRQPCHADPDACERLFWPGSVSSRLF